MIGIFTPTVRRIAGTAITIVLAAAVVLFLAVALMPRVFGVELRSVVSGSMAPAIQDGALVVAVPASTRDVREGDVVMFRAPDGSGRVITHRVVSFQFDGQSRTLETRGDANGASDPWRVRDGQLMGKIVLDVPRLGALADAIRSPAGFVVLLLLPGVFIIAGEAPLWYRMLRRRVQPASADATPIPQSAPPPALAPGPPAMRRPWPFVISTMTLVLAVGFVAGIAYYAAPRPRTDDSSEKRLSAEASSIARHAATLANGDVFNGDLELLRYAEDPRLGAPPTGSASGADSDGAPSPAASPDATAAIQAMMLRTTNPFTSLSLIDAAGSVIAGSDPSVVNVHASAAFLTALATGNIATSDAMRSGASSFIEYAAPIRDVDGAVSRVLLGRAAASRVWTTTLAASIDGGANIITARDGAIIAGTPPDGVGDRWNPGAIRAGVVTARLAGGDVLCGVAPIGRNTHFDNGWQVASCLPASLGLTAPRPSYTTYALRTFSAAVAACAIAILVLAYAHRTRRLRRERNRAPVGYEAIEARLRSMREGMPQ